MLLAFSLCIRCLAFSPASTPSMPLCNLYLIKYRVKACIVCEATSWSVLSHGTRKALWAGSCTAALSLLCDAFRASGLCLECILCCRWTR